MMKMFFFVFFFNLYFYTYKLNYNIFNESNLSNSMTAASPAMTP